MDTTVILCVLIVLMVLFDYFAISCENIKELNKKSMIQALHPKGWKQIVYLILVPLSFITILLMLSSFYGRDGFFISKRLILVGVLWPVSVYDYREYRIPNKLLLAGLTMRACLLFPELLIHRADAFPAIILEVIAAIGAIVICLICMLISRGSMGMGDLKMMAVMALFLGIEGLCYAMAMSVFAAFVASVTLLLTRKKGRKDVIPFAPFFLLGTIASIILSGT